MAAILRLCRSAAVASRGNDCFCTGSGASSVSLCSSRRFLTGVTTPIRSARAPGAPLGLRPDTRVRRRCVLRLPQQSDQMALVHERCSSLMVDGARREERSLDTQLLGMAKSPGHECLGHRRGCPRRFDAALLLRMDAQPSEGETLEEGQGSFHTRPRSDLQGVTAGRRWRRQSRIREQTASGSASWRESHCCGSRRSMRSRSARSSASTAGAGSGRARGSGRRQRRSGDKASPSGST